ncbi:MAG: integrin alpha [Planctomycetota bacterium]
MKLAALAPPLLALSALSAPSHAQTILRTHTGLERWSSLGTDVAFVGDFDADGVDDYALVGRDGELGPTPPPVAIRSGATGAVLLGIGVAAAPGPLRSVARVDDVDGDGVPDLGFASSDAVSVIAGASDTRLWTVTVSSPSTGFGFTPIGDVNLDGVTDLAHTSLGSTSSPGDTTILSGADGALIWSVPLEGSSVARIGDANGDGVDDFAVGNRDASTTGVAAFHGRAYVLDGTDGTVLRMHEPAQLASSQAYGASVCRIDDVDGDGIDDLAVAAPATERNVAYPAFIDLWSTATGQIIRTISRVGDNGMGGGFGGSIVSTGDLDGDGAGDFVVGFESDFPNVAGFQFARAFSGATGRTIGVFPGVAGAGESIDVAPDLDGDGSPELLMGAPLASGANFNDQYRGEVTLFRLEVTEDAVARFCPPSPNVTGAPGRIGWTGSTRVAADDFVLHAAQLPPATFGLFVAEDRFFADRNVVGNGLLCMLSPRRFPTILPTGSGYVSEALDQAVVAFAPFQPLRPGDTWAFQFWSRDGIGAGSNLTDALFVEFR